MKKAKRMCSWCGRREANIAGNRRFPTWCTKKCQEEESDNEMMDKYGIDMKENREQIKKFVTKIKAMR
jgi:hypothetical protein